LTPGKETAKITAVAIPVTTSSFQPMLQLQEAIAIGFVILCAKEFIRLTIYFEGRSMVPLEWMY
jgi:hypothetical protein